MLKDFWTWLVEARQPLIDQAVKASFERAFKDELQTLIDRTHDPVLRKALQDMVDCPIRTARGNCISFTDYIISALIKHGVHERNDMEAALGYVFEKMMVDKTDSGEPRSTVFGGFQERPDYVEGNPLQARFLKFLHFAVNNIAKGRIPRLARTESRPQGTVSITQGRHKAGDAAYGIPSDAIPARPAADTELRELVSDIEKLLQPKEGIYGFPLVAIFRSMMAGNTTRQQRQDFGDRQTQVGRDIIINTIEDYARASGNHALLHLLTVLQQPRQAEKTFQPVQRVVSNQDKDYASLVNVIARYDHPVGTAILGRYRRRWLGYAPRDPLSGHRNRLDDVLAAMIRDDVLRPVQSRQGATLYAPGPNFDQYRKVAEHTLLNFREFAAL